MQEVEALSRAGETVFTALRPYDLHDSIVSVLLFLLTEIEAVVTQEQRTDSSFQISRTKELKHGTVFNS